MERGQAVLLPNPLKFMERETGLEPATATLGRWNREFFGKFIKVLTGSLRCVLTREKGKSKENRVFCGSSGFTGIRESMDKNMDKVWRQALGGSSRGLFI